MPVEIKATFKNNLRPEVKGNLIPIAELAEELAAQIKERVHEQGQSAKGPWSPYASGKTPKKGDRFYWTKVGEDQPELHRITVATQGKYAGRAAYPSRRHYYEALGRDSSGPKKFVLTGELAESIAVTATSANNVQIHYGKKARSANYGKSKSGKAFTNQKVADFAFRKEGIGPMNLSPEETAFVDDFLKNEVPKQLLIDAENYAAEDRAGGLLKRAKRLMKTKGV